MIINESLFCTVHCIILHARGMLEVDYTFYKIPSCLLDVVS